MATKIDAWRDAAGVIYATKRAADLADARRDLRLILEKLKSSDYFYNEDEIADLLMKHTSVLLTALQAVLSAKKEA